MNFKYSVTIKMAKQYKLAITSLYFCKIVESFDSTIQFWESYLI